MSRILNARRSRRIKFRDSNAFLYRMPAGIPGGVNRGWDATIEPNTMGSVTPPTAFGQFVFLDATTGLIRVVATADATVYGLLVRPYPINQQTASGFFGQQLLTDSTVPPTSGPCDILKRGFMTVNTQGTPVAGGAVYVWGAAASGAHVQGGIEAASPGGNGFSVTAVVPCYFRGAADANGNVEIAFNL